jgi:hypothetical protein
LRDRFEHKPRFVHVRREHNRRADELGNLALDGKLSPSPAPVGSPAAATDPALPAATLDDRAIACLAGAASAWARGNPRDPLPAAIWRQLRDIVKEEEDR